jgi:hypothetical protein
MGTRTAGEWYGFGPMRPLESDLTTQAGGADERQSSRLNIKLSQADDRGELLELRDILRESGAGNAALPLIGDPVPGYRANEPVLADVVATINPTAGVVTRILSALRGWLGRRPQRSIELTIGDASIKITGLSSANEDKMVDAFVRRVSGEK